MIIIMIMIMIIIKTIMLDGHYWIDLAQDRERWLAFINVAMNLQVSLNVGNFLTD